MFSNPTNTQAPGRAAPSQSGRQGEESHAPLQVDDNLNDNNDITSDTDSAYVSLGGSSRTGSITSSNAKPAFYLTSSITNYVYENGRRYHAYRSGQYFLPNDEAEQERLDLQHHIWRLLQQGALFTAPLSISQPDDGHSPEAGEFRILDLGCGTGIWAIDMADEFPRASVLGVDLSPIQPDWVPPNCRFHIDDYEDEWTYRDDEKFDYIHGRALSGTVADWPTFYRRVRQHLKPGGWCEMQEYDAWIFSDDDSFDRATWTKEWVTKLDDASKMFGKRINVAAQHKQWMIDAGFKDVREQVRRIPIGSWAKDPLLKELGRFEQLHMQMSVASHTPALFTRVWSFTEPQVKLLIEGVKREFRRKDLRLITSYRFVVGRSPSQYCLNRRG
ncbi:Trans-aconitate 2-methyltransferase [Madurella mycetomatis]|uniref:Trans-aconitate 2-methyltransferase n=1 Tax=Madurella mycetomatis TaxID=100816 RepID=A0A175WFF6_9PEZI|nr:Trans-aconitate 2-methyltransferase [Madurella mycetomatis]